MAVFTLFGQTGTGGTNPTDTAQYTFGVQFSVTQPGCTLTGIWFYSASWATVLPQTIALYTVSGTSLVTSQAASWSGAAASGWVRASFTSPPALTSGTAYKACVLQNTAANWYSGTANYWTTGGGGANGITSGPVTAPNTGGASPSQDSFNAASSLAYPGTASGNAANYWVDPEVTQAIVAAFPFNPGRTWQRRFRHWQQPSPQSTPPLLVRAGLATAHGAALTNASLLNFIPGRAIPGLAVPGDPGGIAMVVTAPGAVASAGVVQPGHTWQRYFQHRQLLVPLSVVVPSTSAHAGLATGTGAALGPSVAITATAGLATGTGAAPQPQAGLGANAGIATGAGAAQAPTAAVGADALLATGTGAALGASVANTAGAGLPTGTGAAQQPSIAITVNAGIATGAGAALAPTVQTSGSTNAPAQLATGAGAAQTPSVALTVPAGLPTGTAAARAASLAIQANAQAATALAAALNVPLNIVNATSSPTVTDPRDGTAAVTAAATSSPAVSDG